MSDVGEQVEVIYLGLVKVFEDLNRLGRDFGEALRAAGLDLGESDEYSTSPSTFEVKTAGTWMFHRPFETDRPRAEQTFAFGAMYAYFDTKAPHRTWKVTPAGRPELWFFLGTTSPPPTIKLASTIRTFFEKADLKSYRTPPTLDGKPVRYEYRGQESWDAVVLGLELGAIRSLDDLKIKAVAPLVEAAKAERLALWE